MFCLVLPEIVGAVLDGLGDMIGLNILTAGGPNNLSTNIIYEVYEKAFSIFATGEASALAVIALFLFVVFLILEFVFVEKRVYYEN